MRENRPYGSEGGEGSALPYPYRSKNYPAVLVEVSTLSTP